MRKTPEREREKPAEAARDAGQIKPFPVGLLHEKNESLRAGAGGPRESDAWEAVHAWRWGELIQNRHEWGQRGHLQMSIACPSLLHFPLQ